MGDDDVPGDRDDTLDLIPRGRAADALPLEALVNGVQWVVAMNGAPLNRGNLARMLISTEGPLVIGWGS